MKNMSLMLGLVLASSVANALSLDEYLRQVEQQNQSFKAYEFSKEAADSKKVSGDLELNPILTIDAGKVIDKAGNNSFIQQMGADKSEITSFSVGLAKRFSSGTAVSLTAKGTDFDNPGVSASFRSFEKYATGSLGVAVQQSLIKDSFGSGTRLRQDREEKVAEASKGGYSLQQRLILTQAEALYWDYMYSLETVKTSEAALARAKRIEGWIRNRVSDGISDRADLLNIQALVAARELAVINAKDEIVAKEKELRKTLELKESDALPELTGDLNKKRALTDLVGGKGKVVSLEAKFTALSAKASRIGAEEVENAYRPDLTLKAAYNTNSYEDKLNEATKNWGQTKTPTTSVGVSFVYMFDTDVKSAQKNAARKEALAAELQANRKQIESDTLWSELNRRYMELTRKIDAATRISEIQTARAKAEADKFNKGRSVTSNVINSEQDAADAEHTLTMLKVEQRKLEAQSRLFIAEETK